MNGEGKARQVFRVPAAILGGGHLLPGLFPQERLTHEISPPRCFVLRLSRRRLRDFLPAPSDSSADNAPGPAAGWRQPSIPPRVLHEVRIRDSHARWRET